MDENAHKTALRDIVDLANLDNRIDEMKAIMTVQKTHKLQQSHWYL